MTGPQDNPAWRQEKVACLRQHMIRRFTALEESIDDFFTLDVKALYAGGGFLVWGSATSEKIVQYAVLWDPLQKHLMRWRMVVDSRFRKQGIGTQCQSLTEQLAEDLDSGLSFIGILPSSLDYWKQQPGYEVRGSKAYKIQ